MRDPATLRVNIYDDCSVDFEAVNVSSKMQDQIEWQSKGGAFTITFESSPFARDTFQVPAGDCARSGPSVIKTPYATFHYVIQGGSDPSSRADPDVNVKR
jgi:hypothetical protein